MCSSTLKFFMLLRTTSNGFLAALLLLGGCASTPAPSASNYSFGLWGDMPYKRADDNKKLPAVLESINKSDIAFSIYDGDIKDGSSKCTDDIYTDALMMFNSMAKPVVYVPGDNEWTDCHRTNNGGYDGLERLLHLRRVMYPTLNSLGQTTMPLEHQGKATGDKFIENVRFSRGPVVFVGLNVPGSNNNVIMSAKECGNKSVRKQEQCDASNSEYLERDTANIAWLDSTFRLAKDNGAKGVVIVVQADVGFDWPETEAVDESLMPEFSGYRNFMAAVIRQTEQFAGQVLFVHGDTHFFKVDKPLYAPTRLLPNFARLQTFGSPSLHWVKVTVDPTTEHLFEIAPVIVRQPAK
jgi:hypothetical protein